jgi:hypothetical protein
MDFIIALGKTPLQLTSVCLLSLFETKTFAASRLISISTARGSNLHRYSSQQM